MSESVFIHYGPYTFELLPVQGRSGKFYMNILVNESWCTRACVSVRWTLVESLAPRICVSSAPVDNARWVFQSVIIAWSTVFSLKFTHCLPVIPQTYRHLIISD